MHARMSFKHAVAAVGAAIAVALVGPVGLVMSAAHADDDGYFRCVANIRNIPLSAPDPNNVYLAGIIEQDLKSGVPPAAEAQKVGQMGFEPRVANGIVHCVMQNNP
jgi:hypothetical protein